MGRSARVRRAACRLKRPDTRVLATAFAALWPAAAPAQTIVLPEIEVIATTPVPGAEIPREKIPAMTHVLTPEDVRLNEVPDFLTGLEGRIGGVTLNNAQGNPFQPNLTYRGFEASPLAGNPQGLAVYVNGARFNQPFGDTVNWDLIPSVAVHRMVLEGANPAFGLNAIGGSLSVELKNGFTWQGAEAELLGGSFGRVMGSLQFGKQIDNVAVYFALSSLREDGWRDFSPSTLRQFYGDIGWRGSSGEVHLNLLAADNKLVGNGTVPVELLAFSRSAVFTHPDETINRFGRLALTGNFEVTDRVSVQGNAYYGRLRQRTKNGDASDAEPCEDDTAFLCLDDDGPPLLARNGTQIPNFVTNSPYRQFPAFAERFEDGGPYAQLNRTSTDTHGYGATAQAVFRNEIIGRPNRFIIGGSFDGGRTRFAATSEVGALTLDRGFEEPGIVIAQPDGAITPVDVKATNAYYGLYFSDVLDVTDRLTATLSGRLNVAKLTLRDQIGTEINGDHQFMRFNPAGGLAYKITPDLTVYGGYSEANRTPTPAELSCADPAAPCSLTNFFVGDPPLKQVVGRTVEAGLRGRFRPQEGTIVNWHLGAFRTETQDDILFTSSDIIGRAFFQNIGATLRQGIEAGISVRAARWNAFIDYAFLDATFRSFLTLNSPENPFADEDGRILVRPGHHLPGIPAHSLKIGFNYLVTDAWKVGLTARAFSGKYLVGDESNLNPKTDPYVVVNLSTSYTINKHLQVFGVVENLFNTKYATFGTFSPTSEVPIIEVPDASVTRSLSPGAPLAVYAGVRARL
jgi:outer membrane receptor protein involved in Fe transport